MFRRRKCTDCDAMADALDGRGRVIAVLTKQVEQWRKAAEINERAYAECSADRRRILAERDTAAAVANDQTLAELASLRDQLVEVHATIVERDRQVASLTLEVEAAWEAQRQAIADGRALEQHADALRRDLDSVRQALAVARSQAVQ